MDTARPTSVDGLDARSVGRWLSEHVDGFAPPYAFELIAGGRSNLTFRGLDDRGRSFVLRRPPLGAVLDTAHDMAREHRILAALAPTDVPVPAALALCDDPAVTGAPFYVMEHLAGPVLRGREDVEEHFATSERGGVAASLIDVLADVHLVEPDDVGLGGLGRREDYLGRQLRRWKRQYDDVRTRDVPLLDEVHAQLEARKPVQQRSGIVHGDYRIDNVVYGPAGVVRGVLDWELCTLGDPLADVGGLLASWVEPGEEGDYLLRRPPSTLDGFPSRAELVERYAAATGLDLSDIDYYVAFSMWRMACIGEGVYARYRDGAMGGPGDSDDIARLAGQVSMLVDRAASALA